jgi:hypothetical protein
MIEVFKTNIMNDEEAQKITRLILSRFPQATISFDLTDCDRILRVQGSVSASEIVTLMHAHQVECEVLQ